MNDTIAAIATPPGEGAVALIRVSGPGSFQVLDRVFSTRSKRNTEDRRSVFGTLSDADGMVDQVLSTRFRAPASFTGEDTVEITCHGGTLVAARILRLLFASGCRPAMPGEFTRRAFENGKIDLTQAEAIMDLIRARTDHALRAASRQLEGQLGAKILDLRSHLLELVAHLEAWIDFPEEDIDPADSKCLQAGVSKVSASIRELLHTAHEGRILREGVRVAIVGKPNAGKSSLLNRLLGSNRAIVSPVAGTTRDTIEESVVLGGRLFHLIDTAGLRDTADSVEREGVARAEMAISGADIVLHLVDGTDSPAGREWIPQSLEVANKCDLPDFQADERAIAVSSLTGEGMSGLVARLVGRSQSPGVSGGESLLAINSRHQAHLEAALVNLQVVSDLLSTSAPLELTALELRSALDSIGRIVGSTSTEDILGEIFSRFCIGK